jgi:hypothetical protein
METVGTSHAVCRSSCGGSKNRKGLDYEDVGDGIHDFRLFGGSGCAWRSDVGRICRH